MPGIGETTACCSGRGGIWNWLDPLTVIRAVAELARAATTSGSSSSGCATRTRTCRRWRWPARAVARGRGARAARPRRLLQRGLGPVRASAARTCSRPTSASRRTSTTSRAASRSAPGCSTASGPGCRSSRPRRLARRPRRASAASAARRLGDVDAWVEALEALLDDATRRPSARERIAAVRERVRVAARRRAAAAARAAGTASPSHVGALRPPARSWVEWRRAARPSRARGARGALPARWRSSLRGRRREASGYASRPCERRSTHHRRASARRRERARAAGRILRVIAGDRVQAQVLGLGRSATSGRSRSRWRCSRCSTSSSATSSSSASISQYYPLSLLIGIVLCTFFADATIARRCRRSSRGSRCCGS